MYAVGYRYTLVYIVGGRGGGPGGVGGGAGARARRRRLAGAAGGRLALHQRPARLHRWRVPAPGQLFIYLI